MEQVRRLETDRERHLYLTTLQDNNETLFFRVLLVPNAAFPEFFICLHSVSAFYERKKPLPWPNLLRRIAPALLFLAAD